MHHLTSKVRKHGINFMEERWGEFISVGCSSTHAACIWRKVVHVYVLIALTHTNPDLPVDYHSANPGVFT